MALKDQMIADANVFFNTDEFGDEATYNGVPVTVIPEIGETGAKGNEIAMEGSADRAVFALKVSEVNAPKPNDKIIHGGKEWQVIRLVETDGIIQRVACVANESPYGR